MSKDNKEFLKWYKTTPFSEFEQDKIESGWHAGRKALLEQLYNHHASEMAKFLNLLNEAEREESFKTFTYEGSCI